MKKIFIPTPLNEKIQLPKDVTHHVLHVFRHNMDKPITVTGSDNRVVCIRLSMKLMVRHKLSLLNM